MPAFFLHGMETGCGIIRKVLGRGGLHIRPFHQN